MDVLFSFLKKGEKKKKKKQCCLQNALKQIKRNNEFSKNLILTPPIHHICIILIISSLLISDAQEKNKEPVNVWMNQCLISCLHRTFSVFIQRKWNSKLWVMMIIGPYFFPKRNSVFNSPPPPSTTVKSISVNTPNRSRWTSFGNPEILHHLIWCKILHTCENEM